MVAEFFINLESVIVKYGPLLKHDEVRIHIEIHVKDGFWVTLVGRV